MELGEVWFTDAHLAKQQVIDIEESMIFDESLIYWLFVDWLVASQQILAFTDGLRKAPISTLDS